MIQTISKHVLDLLQADSRLYQAGTIFTAGWSGVKRQKSGDTPTVGYVNLFDRTFEPQGSDHRPGIYLGMKGMQAVDKLRVVTASGNTGTRQHLRQLILPLILVTQGIGASAIYNADDARWQLVANVRQILYGHLAETNFWYQLEFPGAQAGAQAMIRYWESTTGQGVQAEATAFASFPLEILYTYVGDAKP